MDRTREILDLLRAQEAAIARGDAEGTLAPMDAGSVVYDLPPPLETPGGDARFAEGLRAWFDSWEDGVTCTLHDPTVLVGGDLAVVYGLSRMEGTKRGAGHMVAWNRRTVVLRRTDRGWTILHEHASYPMAMDGSGRAMTDLEPE